MSSAPGRPAAVRERRWLVGLIGAYLIGIVAVAAAYGRLPEGLGSPTNCLIYSSLFIAGAVLIAMLRAARSDPAQPRRAIRAWWQSWKSERGATTIVACLALPTLMAVFLMAKNLIPYVHPFGWDVRLAVIDHALHGAMPWALLQPVLGHPLVTQAISLAYALWFLLLYGSWIWWALSNHEQRARFLLSYTLCWILLGTLMATALSSAGPVFYGAITGDFSVYGDQMSYLLAVDKQIPLLSLEIRDRLWSSYVHDFGSVTSGISAMPSLHVAIATLCAIAGWYVSRRAGIWLTVYAVFIFVGSIHLGWHYAVDGYVSIVGAALIWAAVGWLLRRPAAAASRRRPLEALGFIRSRVL